MTNVPTNRVFKIENKEHLQSIFLVLLWILILDEIRNSMKYARDLRWNQEINEVCSRYSSLSMNFEILDEPS